MPSMAEIMLYKGDSRNPCHASASLSASCAVDGKVLSCSAASIASIVSSMTLLTVVSSRPYGQPKYSILAPARYLRVTAVNIRGSIAAAQPSGREWVRRRRGSKNGTRFAKSSLQRQYGPLNLYKWALFSADGPTPVRKARARSAVRRMRHQ
jgi:hypothetical protein